MTASATVLRSLSELRDVRGQITTVDRPVIARRGGQAPAAPSRLAPEGWADYVAAGDSQRTAAPRAPTLQMRPDEALERLAVLTDVAFDARGLPGMAAFGDAAALALLAAVRSDEALVGERRVREALKILVREAGVVERADSYRATRPLSVLKVMEDQPATDASGFVRVEGGAVVAAARAKEASNCMEVLLATTALDLELLAQLERAKCTPARSLRAVGADRAALEDLLAVREAFPGAGLPILVSLLNHAGFDGRGWPKLDLVRTSPGVRGWALMELRDMRRVLATEDPAVRGEVFVAFCTADTALGPDDYLALVSDYQAVAETEGMDDVARHRAAQVRRTDRARYDAAEARFAAIQRQVGDLQGEALGAVDTIITWVEYRQAVANHLRDERESAKRAEDAKNEALGSIRRVGPQPSERSVSDALEAGNGEEVEVVKPFTLFDTVTLEGAEARRQVTLTDLAGAWERPEVMPGVFWEVVLPPAYLASDVNEEYPDDRMVVIAPRRTNGLGLDMDQWRPIGAAELAFFYTRVAE